MEAAMTTLTNTSQPDLPAAHEVAADMNWRGASGETVSGAEAERHLTATLALLEKRGWTRIADLTQEDASTAALKDASESWSVKRLLLALIRSVLDSDQPVSRPLTLFEALHEIARGEDGDIDSWTVATRCVEAVLRIRTGARFPDMSAWSQKRSRTVEDVRGLLQDAAAFAIQHGTAA